MNFINRYIDIYELETITNTVHVTTEHEHQALSFQHLHSASPGSLAGPGL